MNNKTASLSDVNVSNVTLKELVEFIDAMKEEFPSAIRVLGKKLGAVQSEIAATATEYMQEQLDDEKIIASLELLKGAIGQQAAGDVSSRFVIGLHKEFGFGKIRMLRAFMQQASNGAVPTADELVVWCKARGIDYDEVFAYDPKKNG